MLKTVILKGTSVASFALQDLLCVCCDVGNNCGWSLFKDTMKTAILLVNLVFLCFFILMQKWFTSFHTLKQNWFFFPREACLPAAFFFPVKIDFQPTLHWCQLQILNRFIFFHFCRAPVKKSVKGADLSGRNYQIVVSLKKKIWTDKDYIHYDEALFSHKCIRKGIYSWPWRLIIPFSGEL